MQEIQTISLANIPVDFNSYKNQEGELMMSADLMTAFLKHLLRPEYRFEPYSKQWYKFDGQRWVVNHSVLSHISYLTLQIRANIGPICKQTDKAFVSNFSGSLKTKLEAVPELQIAPDQLDQFGDLLNTPDYIVNLKDNSTASHNPDLLMTQITKVSPWDDDDGKNCPNYIAHLKLVTGNDESLIEYLEMLSGYFLSGILSMQEFYSFYGHGSNGKSVLTQIWMYCMGDYACMSVPGQFGYDGRQQHKEADMRLLGKRLVISEEVSSWDIAKLKQWTDGGDVVARKMHGESVGFKPQCKLLFISNVKPALTSNDYGLERRLRLIPFDQRIADEQRDFFFLEQKLKPEAAFILNRMTKAAQKFFVNGKIETPTVVADISKDYFNEENIIGLFIGEKCQPLKDHTIIFGTFYDKLITWGNSAGFEIPSKKKISQLLENMGYKRGRTSQKCFIQNIEWKESSVVDYHPPDGGLSPVEDWHDKYE
jgi:putative DNA primase/helicase